MTVKSTRPKCAGTTATGKRCRRNALADHYLCEAHQLAPVEHLPQQIQSIVTADRIRTGLDRDLVATGGKSTAWMPARLRDRNRAAVRAERVYLKLTPHERAEFAEWIGTTAERVAWFRGVESGDICDYRNTNWGAVEIPSMGGDRMTAGNHADEFDVVAETRPPALETLRAKLDYLYSEIDADAYVLAVGDEPPEHLTKKREWLRPYQCVWLLDPSRYRIARKSRQIGWTDVGVGMESVGTSSGLYAAAGWPVLAHNCLIVSRNLKCAKEAVAKATDWVKWFGEDPDFAYFMGLSTANTEKLEFERSGFGILAEARSVNAGVSYTGHVYFDEFAVWGLALQEQIFRVAMPMISSNPGLRASIVSTTRGTAEMFYELWSDEAKYRDWRRHFVDVYEAIRQGFPLDPEEARRNFCRTDEDWAQEFEAKFVGTGAEYIKREQVVARMGPAPADAERITRNIGIDVASEKDLTAIVPVDLFQTATWWRQPYILQGLPYISDDKLAILGQDRVLIALLIVLCGVEPGEVDDAITAVMDRSGDGAVLYGAMSQMSPPCKLVGHSFHRAGQKLKNKWVPEIRGALERGDLWVEDATALEYSKAAAAPHIVDNQIPDPHAFVAHAFIDRQFPQLLMDFLKVHRRQTKNSGMTFDTSRDAKHGHGDSFWAGFVGHIKTYVRRIGDRPGTADTSAGADYEPEPEPEYPDASDDLDFGL